MMDLESGAYYGLNEVGARIWSLIETPTSVADICRTLRAEFRVGEEVCLREVVALLNELDSRSLLDVQGDKN